MNSSVSFRTIVLLKLTADLREMLFLVWHNH